MYDSYKRGKCFVVNVYRKRPRQAEKRLNSNEIFVSESTNTKSNKCRGKTTEMMLDKKLLSSRSGRTLTE